MRMSVGPARLEEAATVGEAMPADAGETRVGSGAVARSRSGGRGVGRSRVRSRAGSAAAAAGVRRCVRVGCWVGFFIKK